jgi:hypothetical protein
MPLTEIGIQKADHVLTFEMNEFYRIKHFASGTRKIATYP